MEDSESTIVLTGADMAMRRICDITTPGKRRWAERHGYGFMCRVNWETKPHIVWQKMFYIYRMLKTFDTVVWLDADAVITNPALSAADVAPDNGQGMYIPADWDICPPEELPYYFNTGNMVVRNGPRMNQLFEKMFRDGTERWWTRWGYEQSTLQEIKKAGGPLADVIHVLPGLAMNAVPAQLHPRTVNPWDESSFLAHLTGIENRERLDMLHSPWMKNEYR